MLLSSFISDVIEINNTKTVTLITTLDIHTVRALQRQQTYSYTIQYQSYYQNDSPTNFPDVILVENLVEQRVLAPNDSFELTQDEITVQLSLKEFKIKTWLKALCVPDFGIPCRRKTHAQAKTNKKVLRFAWMSRDKRTLGFPLGLFQRVFMWARFIQQLTNC